MIRARVVVFLTRLSRILAAMLCLGLSLVVLALTFCTPRGHCMLLMNHVSILDRGLLALVILAPAAAGGLLTWKALR